MVNVNIKWKYILKTKKMVIALIILIVIAYPLYRYKKEYDRKQR